MVRVRVRVVVKVMVSKLLWSNKGQDTFRVIVRVRVKLGLGLGLLVDSNHLLTQSLSL